jgi:hypothetical protein
MRLKKLLVSGELILEIFKNGKHDGYEVLSDYVPKDAKIKKIISSFKADELHVIELVIESEDFDDINENEEIPVLLPKMESIPVLKKL